MYIYSLADVRWEEVEPYMVLSVFLLVSVLAKLMFHSAHWLSTRVPESCVLILVGLVFGGVLFAGDIKLKNKVKDRRFL